MTGVTETDVGLTLSDLAAVVGVCAVVMAALLAPVGIALRRYVRRQKVADKRLATHLKETARYRKNVADVSQRGFAGTANSLEFTAGLLQRIMTDRINEIECRSAMQELFDLRLSVDRAWMEMRLLTSDETAQTSSLQQLQKLGDRRTEILLRDEAVDTRLSESNERLLNETLRVIHEREPSRGDEVQRTPPDVQDP